MTDDADFAIYKVVDGERQMVQGARRRSGGGVEVYDPEYGWLKACSSRRKERALKALDGVRTHGERVAVLREFRVEDPYVLRELASKSAALSAAVAVRRKELAVEAGYPKNGRKDAN